MDRRVGVDKVMIDDISISFIVQAIGYLRMSTDQYGDMPEDVVNKINNIIKELDFILREIR